jgi:uncharacterized membrane protein YgaE (UPF0421/DUF939 family)
MQEPIKPTWPGVNRKEVVHTIRTTIAALVSLLVARLFQLPEAYWAAVTTMIVMQSTLGGALTVSKQRLAGTALGAAAGALLATYTNQNAFAFGGGLLVLGFTCAALRMERNAYRYAGITLAIVMLVPRTEPGWIIAMHRFIEISIGIVVGLALTAIWPEPEPTAA